MIKVSDNLSKEIKKYIQSELGIEAGIILQYVSDLELEVRLLQGNKCRFERELNRYREYIAELKTEKEDEEAQRDV